MPFSNLTFGDGSNYGFDCDLTLTVNCGGGGDLPDGGDPSNPDDGDDNANGGVGGSTGGGKKGITTDPILGTCIETNTCVQIENNLLDPCANNLFTEIENGIFMDDPVKPEVQVPNIEELNFAESILTLFNNSDSTDYSITNGDLPGSNAQTLGASTIISNSYLASATELSIVRTMIHEMVHAYINALYSNPLSFNSFTFREKIEIYAEDNGYVIGSNEFHHNFMGQYIDAIAISLYEWDKDYGTGGSLGWNYYKSMAYSGMFQVDPSGKIVSFVDTFSELVPNADDRQEVADIVINEQNNNEDANGTDCE